MALTAKQQRFVDAYTGNGTAAARAAGYQGDDAALATAASRLLRNAEVKKALEARRAGVTAARADAAEAAAIASRAARQAFWTEVMQDTKVEMKDRLKASELLGKSEADFKEKVEHSGAMALTVTDPYAEPKK